MRKIYFLMGVVLVSSLFGGCATMENRQNCFEEIGSSVCEKLNKEFWRTEQGITGRYFYCIEDGLIDERARFYTNEQVEFCYEVQ